MPPSRSCSIMYGRSAPWVYGRPLTVYWKTSKCSSIHIATSSRLPSIANLTRYGVAFSVGATSFWSAYVSLMLGRISIGVLILLLLLLSLYVWLCILLLSGRWLALRHILVCRRLIRMLVALLLDRRWCLGERRIIRRCLISLARLSCVSLSCVEKPPEGYHSLR